MWQALVAYALVAVALAWVVWTYCLPRALRRRLRRVAGRGAEPEHQLCGGCSGCSDRPPCHPEG